jgi:hypothetical protein
MFLIMLVMLLLYLLYPRLELGLPRPQRGVLTTRRIEPLAFFMPFYLLEMPGFDPGASCLQSTRSSN